jgi:hypothetical protein
MNRFDLPNNFIDNLEALFRRTRAKLKKAQASSSIQSEVPSEEEDHQRVICNLTPVFKAMANKSLYEFSAPTTDNIRTRPAADIDRPFELKPTLINMVEASQFVGRHMKMLVLISNTFWRFAALSPSRMFPEMPYYFAFSHSHSWRE